MKKKKIAKKISLGSKIYVFLLMILPAVLFFSYYPLIKLGEIQSMNFELSLPIIWLMIFDLFGFYLWIKAIIQKRWIKPTKQKLISYLPWATLPVFVSLSVAWSLNPLRGALTVGLMWLICLAIVWMVTLKTVVEWPDNFRRNFWRWFFGASLLIAAWCWLQCILDVAGVGREYTLMCEGCTAQMFGFPHPNGMAIEPQFMGNLLIAPTLIAAWFSFRRKRAWPVLMILVVTLFLTFSRGAIYAFIIGLIVLTVLQLTKTRRWQILWIWPAVIVGFLFTLNAQGIMAMVGPTNDTYAEGIAKVVHQMSLGVIDVRNEVKEVEEAVASETDEVTEQADEALASADDEGGAEAVFDGYVQDSTNVRLTLTDSALRVWQSSPKNMLVGVGIGGAGQALYDDDLSPAPKEIIQNEYASMLLETGLVGMILVILTLVMIIKVTVNSSMGVVMIPLIIAYMVTLCFFSGLANALQIYLLPALLIVLRKKLVS